MASNALVFTVQKDANDYAAAVDSKYGYPKPGKDIGGGVHAPPAQSVTTSHAAVTKHPTLALWSYPDSTPSDTSASKPVADVPLPGTATKQSLDATWTPVLVGP